jgi:flagellar brake protein
MSNTELDNWHDYRVVSRREIVGLLRQIGEKNQLVRMLVHGEADVCVTSILDVDPDNGTFLLDRSIERDQNRRIVNATNKIACETSLDKIRILFKVENVREIDYDKSTALEADIPESLVRLQRREFYRMATPVTNPVRIVVPLPEELGGGSATFPLADISCGGIAFLDNKQVLGDAAGRTLEGCSLDLPDVGMVTTNLEIRNMQDVTLLNNKTARRFGCMFVGISRGNLGNVQRYITKLERERNARLAGLG